MARKPTAKPPPKLTDAERHRRFVTMAREVEADESPKAFDKAFKRIVSRQTVPSPKGHIRKDRS